MALFRYLNQGITFILIFIGAKMLASGLFEISAVTSLAVIVFILASSIALSLRFPKRRAGSELEKSDLK